MLQENKSQKPLDLFLTSGSPSLEDLDGEICVPVDGSVQVWADGAIHWLGRETGDASGDVETDVDVGGGGDDVCL